MEALKFSPMKIISVILGLFILVFVEVSVAEWRFYANSEFGSYHYEAENINYSSKHSTRVWQKLILSDKGVVNLVVKLGKEYAEASEAITLREIDCVKKKSRILELVFHSREGNVIKKESYEPFEWDPILPDSVDEFLHLAVCN